MYTVIRDVGDRQAPVERIRRNRENTKDLKICSCNFGARLFTVMNRTERVHLGGTTSVSPTTCIHLPIGLRLKQNFRGARDRFVCVIPHPLYPATPMVACSAITPYLDPLPDGAGAGGTTPILSHEHSINLSTELLQDLFKRLMSESTKAFKPGACDSKSTVRSNSFSVLLVCGPIDPSSGCLASSES